MASSGEDSKGFLAAAKLHDVWISLLGRNPKETKWTVGQAMRECGFSVDESKNPTFQQRVRRMEKALHSGSEALPSAASVGTVPVNVVDISIQSPVSAISEPSSTTFASQHSSILGGCRRTSKQVNAAWKNEHQTATAKQELHKQCTSWVAAAKKKEETRRDGGRKKGVQKLREDFAAEYSVSVDELPSVRSIQEAIQRGTAGQTPKRRGPKGTLDEGDFKQLGKAVSAFVCLSASNGDEKTYVELKRLVNTVANSLEGKSFPDRYDYTLIERIFKQFGINLSADEISYAEARRVLWTTRSNLEIMFVEWKRLLLELEMAKEKTEENCVGAVELTLENIEAGFDTFCTGEVVFSIEQLRRIINVDETCLSLDGLGAGKGGRPSLSFHNSMLPRAGKAASKCGGSATLVIGGNAAGEATPPHFQFPSTAQEQNQQIKFATVENARDICGQFGHAGPTRLSPTYGMNEKGGMDEAHFEQYLIDLMYALYPDVADSKGKQVVVKADQGPGRSNIRLLARLRARGIYLFPSVPNTSSVSQEMDQIFNVFKRLARLNVERLHDALMKAGRSVSLGRDDCTKIVFGGLFTLENGTAVELEEAFDKSFCMRRMLQGFAAVGAAPLTRKCLQNERVRVELSADSSEDSTPVEHRLRILDEQLQACVSYLLIRGFKKANALLVRAKQKKEDQPVTMPHTLERQLAFNNAKTTGAKYKALHGTHCTHDDMFIARAIDERSKELKEMEEKKLAATNATGRANEALALIEKKEAEGLPVERLLTDKKKWKVTELDILLKWKLGKVPPEASNKEAKVVAWQQVKAKAAVVFAWTDADETRLESLKQQVTVDSTELRKERRRLKQDAVAAVGAMSLEELDAFKAQVDATRAAKSGNATTATSTTLSDTDGQSEEETPPEPEEETPPEPASNEEECTSESIPPEPTGTRRSSRRRKPTQK